MLHLALACLLAAEPDQLAAGHLVADALAAWNVPGAAVVVVHGDDTRLLRGFGVRQKGRREPVTPDTVFPLASCSKAFTTTLMAMLADDGLLTWDDPVRKHLPSFKLSDPHADALVTLRDLLTHRTGVSGHDLLWYHSPGPLDDVLKRVAFLPLDYPFRGGYRYSSIMYLAAGRAIERTTGEKWEKLVRTRICDPLGMTGVTFTTTDIPKNADRASGHRLGKDGQVGPMPAYEMTEPNPSGSVNATARDLAAWLKFHLARGIGPDGRRMVSVKNFTEMHTPQNVVRVEGVVRALNPDTVQVSYALGWLVQDYRGKKVLTHGGMIDGFRVQITMLPDENLGVAILTNLHDTRMNAALTNSLIDLYCNLPTKDWNAYYRKVTDEETAERKAALSARDKARNPDAKPTLPLAGYAGEYTHPAYGTAVVSETDGKLVLKWSAFNSPLLPFEADTFRATDGQFEEQLVVFGVTNGKVTSLRFIGQVFKRK